MDGPDLCNMVMWIIITKIVFNARIMPRDEFSECDTDVQLDGKVAIVTGATSGIGLDVAKNLSKRGARVIIASRNSKNLEKAKHEIIKSSGRDNVITRQMDFESLTSIRHFAQDTIRTEPRLDILINNIGAFGLEDKLTEDGLHTMMQVNYFGMFLLTYLLFPLLKSSAPSRVVNVASLAIILGSIDFDHWNDVRRHSSLGYYANAKLAMILFTVEMDRRTKNSGVSVYSMDPGLTQRQIFDDFETDFWKIIFIFGRPSHRVATMPVFLAVDPRLEKSGGKHFRDCMEFYSTWFANDTILTERVWRESKKLVKITREEDWELLDETKCQHPND